MKFRVLFIAIALVAMTSLAFSSPSVHFDYWPYDAQGNPSGDRPISSGTCWTGTPFPDGTVVNVYDAGDVFIGSFLMNGAVAMGAAGYFYPDNNVGDAADVPGTWHLVTTYDGCTYTSVGLTIVDGPQQIILNESDWTCVCDEPPPTCVWFDHIFSSVCLTFTEAGEENGIEVCWCCPFGVEPWMLSGFGWIPGCNYASIPWYDGCDDPCAPYSGAVYFSAQTVVADNDDNCPDPEFPGVGHWTMKVWTDGPGCICLHWDHQLPVELTAEPVLQIGDRQVTLSFEVADELNVTHYDIMRDGAKVAELEVADGSYTYVDQNVANGHRYGYSIVAVGLAETVELDRDGNTVWTATPSFKAAVVTEYALHQNYPNPFNPSTEIVYDVLDLTHVTLKVYNVMGQEVANLVDTELSTGRYAVTFDASGLTSGLYFYTVSMGDFTATKKMLLVQ